MRKGSWATGEAYAGRGVLPGRLWCDAGIVGAGVSILRAHGGGRRAVAPPSLREGTEGGSWGKPLPVHRPRRGHAHPQGGPRAPPPSLSY